MDKPLFGKRTAIIIKWFYFLSQALPHTSYPLPLHPPNTQPFILPSAVSSEDSIENEANAEGEIREMSIGWISRTHTSNGPSPSLTVYISCSKPKIATGEQELNLD